MLSALFPEGTQASTYSGNIQRSIRAHGDCCPVCIGQDLRRLLQGVSCLFVGDLVYMSTDDTGAFHHDYRSGVRLLCSRDESIILEPIAFSRDLGFPARTREIRCFRLVIGFVLLMDPGSFAIDAEI